MLENPKKPIYNKTFLAILLLSFPISAFALSMSIFADFFATEAIAEKVSPIRQETLQTLRVFEPNKVFASVEEFVTKRPNLMDEDSTSFEIANSFLDDLDSQDSDNHNHNENAIYTVQAGDSIYSIASYFGVSVDTIMTFNHMPKKMVHVGDVLEVPSVSGVLYEIEKGDTMIGIAKKYDIDIDDLTLYTGLSANEKLTVGEEIFLPNAKEDVKVKKTTTITKTINGVSSSKTFVKDATVKKSGSWAKGDTAHLNTPAAISKYSNLKKIEGYFLFPAPGSTRTQKMHGNNGVDFANKIGSQVLASADGVVAVAKTSGYNYGYGNYIKITHPNGTETIYGHLSKVNVSVGQSVTRGQLIGAVGSTGNSTGPHLHFEIHGAYNPFAW